MNLQVDAQSRAEKRALIRRLVFFCALLAVPALFSANPLLTVTGVGVVPLLFALLWRSDEPPVLLFAAGFQWLQVFMPVFNADRRGDVISDWNIETAAWLGLVAILVLAAGMRMGVGRKPIVDAESLAQATRQLDVRRLAWAYVLAFFLGELAIQVAGFVPGLRQQLLALGVLRWAVTFLIGWAALRNPQFRPLAFVVFLVEVALGFSGYFGGFKAILFLAVVLITASRRDVRKVLRPSLALAFVATLLLASFWQIVKDDYRSFISGGERAQVVRVPITSRFAFLLDKIVETSWNDLQDGFESALDRVGYLDFFARTIQMVPARIPFQRGRLWLEALTHIVTPRILFPNKAAINDSDRTREFTGVWAAGAEEGTSISIGYAGESYIDFGPLGMFVPIFLLGCFWGWSYRWVATRSRQRLLGLAVSTNLILSGAIYFESSNIKLFGGAVSSLIVLWILLRRWGDDMWRFVAPGRRAPPIREAAMVIPASVAVPVRIEEGTS